jgi:uncharacterized sporulation protein YeaH/YhbH (DUF444 family)
MSDAPQTGSQKPATGQEKIVLQNEKGEYFAIPLTDIDKYKVDPDSVGGGALIPAGCGVCCVV